MSLKFVFRELKLAAGEKKRVHEVASFFMLVSNTGDEKVKISIDDSSLSDIPIGYEYREKKEDTFYKHIDFKNPNAVEVTIEYIMSSGIVRSSPTIISLDEILAEFRGDTTAEGFNQVQVGVNAVQIIAANTDRKSFTVQAKLSNTGIIYVGFDDTIAYDKWWTQLEAGQSCGGDDYRGAVWAKASVITQYVGIGEV